MKKTKNTGDKVLDITKSSGICKVAFLNVFKAGYIKEALQKITMGNFDLLQVCIKNRDKFRMLL